MTMRSAAGYRGRIFSLSCMIDDIGILQRITGILEGASSAQEKAAESSGTEESRERMALIGEIGSSLAGMSVEQLRRLDWYAGRITKNMTAGGTAA